MLDPSWAPVVAQLDRAAKAGRRLRIWLRDDDAVAETPALHRLATLCARYRMPILLAVIPEPADSSLARFCARHPDITPTQHGFRHTNHAAPGEKARELGGARGRNIVLDELRSGRAQLSQLFGTRAADILVPPWNRIDEDLVPQLPALGFRALSTFGPAASSALPHLNCDIDPIDWRHGKVCRPEARLLRDLEGLIGERTDGDPRPIGLLTHHLAHDEAVWAFCEAALRTLVTHPAVQFVSAESLLRDGASPPARNVRSDQ